MNMYVQQTLVPFCLHPGPELLIPQLVLFPRLMSLMHPDVLNPWMLLMERLQRIWHCLALLKIVFLRGIVHRRRILHRQRMLIYLELSTCGASPASLAPRMLQSEVHQMMFMLPPLLLQPELPSHPARPPMHQMFLVPLLLLQPELTSRPARPPMHQMLLVPLLLLQLQPELPSHPAA